MKTSPYTSLCIQFRILMLVVIFGPMQLFSQEHIAHISPPHWWIGFEDERLELMIYGEELGMLEPSIDYPGVHLANTIRPENSNYLILQLEIDRTAEPGLIEITLSNPESKDVLHQISYELRERQLLGLRPKKGIEPSDILYLIMPDRFANGDLTNDIVDGMLEAAIDRTHIFKRHGGDLQGVMDHIPYLEELGVTGIWLNPVVENNQPSTSYHGYACTNGYQIDPRFGSNQLYKALVDSLHAHDMKIVMDVVYNHWGSEHWIMRDLPDSSWVNFWPDFTQTNYRSTTWMDPYASEADQRLMCNGWFDVHMPDLNQRNPQLATYLIQQTKWWVEEWGIDALRIDTYAYPDQAFMMRLERELALEFPDLFLFGETWVHGISVQSWFTHQEGLEKAYQSGLKSVTDFQLYYAIKDAMNEDFGWTTGASRVYYTLAKDWVYEAPSELVTFLDNHDVSRFYSEVHEDPKRFQMGIILLLTTRGIPCLYYGTEIMMKNFADPDGKVRSDFPGGWPADPIDKFAASGRDSAEAATFRLIQQLGHYRKHNPALFNGDLMQFVPEDGLYTYFRYTDDACLMVVMNMNETPMEIKLDRYEERLHSYKEGIHILTNEVYPLEGEWVISPWQALVLELRK